jgi:biotin-dependent carboxylase-like uncharacterized protein
VDRELAVIRSGPLTTVQDLGRPGWAHLGVPRSGAADRASLRLANRLVGNPEGAAALEVTIGGLELEAVGDLSVAITGAPGPISIDGVPSPSRVLLRLPAGVVLRIGVAAVGVRAYLAVRGGLDLPPVLGSRSTDTLSGLGPAPIVDGDRLAVGSQQDRFPVLTVAPGHELPSGTVQLDAVLGPRNQALAAGGRELLASTTWRVSERSDRVGLRLVGPALPVVAAWRTPSEGVIAGAMQLPPGGQPMIFLADHPVTGGYPVVAVLTDAEVDRAGQLRPGQGVRFTIQNGYTRVVGDNFV